MRSMDLLTRLRERKDITVLLWVAASNAIIAVLSYVIGNPDLYSPVVVGLANILLVSFFKRNQ